MSCNGNGSILVLLDLLLLLRGTIIAVIIASDIATTASLHEGLHG